MSGRNNSTEVNIKTESKMYNCFEEDDYDKLEFYIIHKGKRSYFEFPSITDQSYMLTVIKSRISLHRGFCLGWLNRYKSDKKKKKRLSRHSTGFSQSKHEDVFIHSTNINSETMREFCGETFYVVHSDSGK